MNCTPQTSTTAAKDSLIDRIKQDDSKRHTILDRITGGLYPGYPEPELLTWADNPTDLRPKVTDHLERLLQMKPPIFVDGFEQGFWRQYATKAIEHLERRQFEPWSQTEHNMVSSINDRAKAHMTPDQTRDFKRVMRNHKDWKGGSQDTLLLPTQKTPPAKSNGASSGPPQKRRTNSGKKADQAERDREIRKAMRGSSNGSQPKGTPTNPRTIKRRKRQQERAGQRKKH